MNINEHRLVIVADTVNSVARMLNVLSVLSPVCTGQSNMVDFVEFQ